MNMKKLIYSMFALAIMAMTFTSCEDVPAPYALPGNEEINPDGGSVFNLPYKSVSCNDWTVSTIKGIDWSLGSSYAKASGYTNGVTTETESWLVSPIIRTTSSTGVIINLEHVIRYTRSNNDLAKHKLLVSSDYVDNVATATWKQLAYKPVASPTNTWDFYESNTIQLPDEYLNKDVVFAFKFECGSDNSTTWEVKNVEIKEGTGGDTNADDTPTETIGSADNPITTTDAFNRINVLSNGEKTAEFAYVKGKIVKVLTNADNFAKYGNISYYISDDGTTANQVQVYAGDGLNGEKFKAVTDIKAGDEVVVFGHLYKYVNNNTGAVTPEISESYLISLKSGSGGDPTPSGEGKGSGTAADPYNPIAAINYAKSLGADVESSNEVYVKGKISSIKFTYSAQYGTATYNISEDGSTANEFTVYGSYYFNNQSWKEGDTQIKVGDEVVVCGKVVYYQGNTPEFANKKNWLVSLNSGSGGGGGDSGGGGETTGNVTKEVSGTTLTLTVNDATADNSVTVDLGAQGWSNAQEVTSLTLSDGTVITFAVSSEGGTTPKYYDGTKGVRLYAKNILTITGKDKGIAKVVLNCDSYQGTNYVGNTTLTANASGKSLTIVNEHTGTSGGVQLRVKTMEITYAK